MCGAQCKTQARGPSERWCYYVVVLSQPCYDLFDEDILEKQLHEYKKRRQILLELICMYAT